MPLITDSATGLGLIAPEGWVRVSSPLIALVIVDEGARSVVPPVFMSNVVGTVAELPEGTTIVEFTQQSTTAWATSIGQGTVLNVGLHVTDGVEGREVVGSYAENGRAVTTVTYLYVHNGLGTRIDVSFGVWDTPEGIAASRQIVEGLVLPTSATKVDGNLEQQLAQTIGGALDGSH